MKEQPHILVVDDHAEIRRSVSQYLQRNGMRATGAQDAVEMDAQLEVQTIDLIVLDVMMPGEDGLSVCKRLRETLNIPVLMLTALGEDDDLIAGLDGGADDYLAKPFNPKELLARIRAILRRVQGNPQTQSFAGKTLRFAHLELDFDGRILIDPAGTRTTLTTGEMKLLTLLLERPRIVLDRDHLLEMTTGRTARPFDRTIDNHISRLRRKIEVDVLRPRVISTVRNGGYSLACDVEVVS